MAIIVALIYLNGGLLAEGFPSLCVSYRTESLNRYMRFLSIEDNTPLMSTEKFVATMVKQGYIDKVKDTASGEPRHDFHLGPRGKIEVGRQGTMDLVKEVFSDDMDKDLEKRVKRCMAELKAANGENVIEEPEEATQGNTKKRVRRAVDEEDEEERPTRGTQNRRHVSEREEAVPARRRRPRPDPEEEEEAEEDEEAPRSRRSHGLGNGSSRSNSRPQKRRGRVVSR